MATLSSMVEKATSDLLSGPDWGLNMDLYDFINRDPHCGQDVVKAIKKRLGHRNPKVQLLTLTLLEACMKNCNEGFHHNLAHREFLPEMVKVCTKKADREVREKALALLDDWKEAFGGPNGKYPQYWDAYDQVKRRGIEFPPRNSDDHLPIFSSPPTQQGWPPSQYAEPPRTVLGVHLGGMPHDGVISLSEMQTARHALEVLESMLAPLTPRDQASLRIEVIGELVDQARTSQRRVLHLVSNCSDEAQLREALSLNDDLTRVLARHDALADSRQPSTTEPVAQSQAPLKRPVTQSQAPVKRLVTHRQAEITQSGGNQGGGMLKLPTYCMEEEDEDEFRKLAHRSSRRSSGSEGRPQGPLATLVPPPNDNPKTPRCPRFPPGQREKMIDLLSGELGGPLPPAKTDVVGVEKKGNASIAEYKASVLTRPASVRTRVKLIQECPERFKSPSTNPFADPAPAGTSSPPYRGPSPFETATQPHPSVLPPSATQGAVGLDTPYVTPALPSYLAQAPYATQATPNGGFGVEPTFKVTSYGSSPSLSHQWYPSSTFSTFSSPVNSPQGGATFSPKAGEGVLHDHRASWGGAYGPRVSTSSPQLAAYGSPRGVNSPLLGVNSPLGGVDSPPLGLYSPRQYQQDSPLQPTYFQGGQYQGGSWGASTQQDSVSNALAKLENFSVSQKPQSKVEDAKGDLFRDLVQLGGKKCNKQHTPGVAVIKK